MYIYTPQKTVNHMTTVKEKMKLYTKRQNQEAEKAKKLMKVLLFPSVTDLKHVVKNNEFPDNPVTLEHINIIEDIHEKKRGFFERKDGTKED